MEGYIQFVRIGSVYEQIVVITVFSLVLFISGWVGRRVVHSKRYSVAVKIGCMALAIESYGLILFAALKL